MSETQLTPLVSIVIPVYNGANYLREAIDSALNQTYKNIEVLVINDGSTDDGATDRIACSYGNSIRYYKKPNGGVATALNLGIQKMSGEYFSWLSHDDLYAPFKIEAQIKFINEKNLRGKAVYSDCIFIKDTGDKIAELKAGDTNSYSIRYHLTKQSTVHGCSLLIPKEVFLKVGLFDETLKATQDYDMWHRISEEIEFHYLSIPLVHSRQHAAQDSRTLGDKMINECDSLKSRFISKLSTTDLPKDVNATCSALHLADVMIKSGYYNAALAALRLAKENLDSESTAKKIKYHSSMVAKTLAIKRKKLMRGLNKLLSNGT